MAAGMASNPVTYLLYKTATLLDNVAGGIAIPAFSVMGNMVDLETTVSDLMRVAAMSGGILSGLGNMIGNLGAGGGFSGSGMLKALGVTGYNRVSRGGGYVPVASSGSTLSESGSLVGNNDSNAIMDKTMGDAEDDKKSKMAEAKKEEDSWDIEKLYTAENGISAIYNLIEKVVNGSAAIRVKRDDDLA